MATRANWFLAELEGLSTDEFDEDPFAQPIEEVGTPIELGDDEARLKVELVELMRRESNLFNAEITCAIKDRSDTCCHACPVSQAHSREEPLGTLCRLGRQQERVQSELGAVLVAKCLVVDQ